MPRKRMIKPEFWTDPKILCLKRDVRLFFIGIWNFANDEGIIENNTISLKVKIYPGDEDLKQTTIEKYINSLIDLDLLIKGTDAKGHNLLKVTNWSKHQKISHPTPSEYIFEPIKEEDLEPSNRAQGESSEDSLVVKYSIDKYSIDKNSIKVKEIPEEITFDQFYSIYPRKVKKKTADRAFNKLSKKERILAIKGLEKYNLYWLNNNIDKAYIPHPSSWLNAKQWEDEINVEKPIESKNPLDKEISRRHQRTQEQSSKLRHYLEESTDKAEPIPNLLADFKEHKKTKSNAKPIGEIIRQSLSPSKPNTSTDE